MHGFMQVFISYGRKSNGELLLSYGFVPREGTNPRDSVELSLSIKKTDKCYKEKLEALKKQGLSAWVLEYDSLFIWFLAKILICELPSAVNRSHCYPLQITGWPLELMAYACLAVSPPSMRSQYDEVRWTIWVCFCPCHTQHKHTSIATLKFRKCTYLELVPFHMLKLVLKIKLELDSLSSTLRSLSTRSWARELAHGLFGKHVNFTNCSVKKLFHCYIN